MGRMHLEMAMRFKLKNLIISDVLNDRLERAKNQLTPKAQKLGINLMAVQADELEKTVKELSGGAGADDIILAVGIKPVQQAALKLLGRGGVANLFGGLPKGQEDLVVSAIKVHYDEIKLVGSSGGDPSDLKTALDAIANNDIDSGNYVCGVGSLKHAGEVLKGIKESKVDGKVILYPHCDIDELQHVDYWDKSLEEKFLLDNLKL